VTDEYRSYLVGRISPDGEIAMLDEPIDEGPVTPVKPWEFVPINEDGTTRPW
jgi:hypothetical protein